MLVPEPGCRTDCEGVGSLVSLVSELTSELTVLVKTSEMTEKNGKEFVLE